MLNAQQTSMQPKADDYLFIIQYVRYFLIKTLVPIYDPKRTVCLTARSLRESLLNEFSDSILNKHQKVLKSFLESHASTDHLTDRTGIKQKIEAILAKNYRYSLDINYFDKDAYDKTEVASSFSYQSVVLLVLSAILDEDRYPESVIDKQKFKLAKIGQFFYTLLDNDEYLTKSVDQDRTKYTKAEIALVSVLAGIYSELDFVTNVMVETQFKIFSILEPRITYNADSATIHLKHSSIDISFADFLTCRPLTGSLLKVVNSCRVDALDEIVRDQLGDWFKNNYAINPKGIRVQAFFGKYVRELIRTTVTRLVTDGVPLFKAWSNIARYLLQPKLSANRLLAKNCRPALDAITNWVSKINSDGPGGQTFDADRKEYIIQLAALLDVDYRSPLAVFDRPIDRLKITRPIAQLAEILRPVLSINDFFALPLDQLKGLINSFHEVISEFAPKRCLSVPAAAIHLPDAGALLCKILVLKHQESLQKIDSQSLRDNIQQFKIAYTQTALFRYVGDKFDVLEQALLNMPFKNIMLWGLLIQDARSHCKFMLRSLLRYQMFDLLKSLLATSYKDGIEYLRRALQQEDQELTQLFVRAAAAAGVLYRMPQEPQLDQKLQQILTQLAAPVTNPNLVIGPNVWVVPMPIQPPPINPVSHQPAAVVDRAVERHREVTELAINIMDPFDKSKSVNCSILEQDEQSDRHDAKDVSDNKVHSTHVEVSSFPSHKMLSIMPDGQNAIISNLQKDLCVMQRQIYQLLEPNTEFKDDCMTISLVLNRFSSIPITINFLEFLDCRQYLARSGGQESLAAPEWIAPIQQHINDKLDSWISKYYEQFDDPSMRQYLRTQIPLAIVGACAQLAKQVILFRVWNDLISFTTHLTGSTVVNLPFATLSAKYSKLFKEIIDWIRSNDAAAPENKLAKALARDATGVLQQHLITMAKLLCLDRHANFMLLAAQTSSRDPLFIQLFQMLDSVDSIDRLFAVCSALEGLLDQIANQPCLNTAAACICKLTKLKLDNADMTTDQIQRDLDQFSQRAADEGISEAVIKPLIHALVDTRQANILYGLLELWLGYSSEDLEASCRFLLESLQSCNMAELLKYLLIDANREEQSLLALAVCRKQPNIFSLLFDTARQSRILEPLLLNQDKKNQNFLMHGILNRLSIEQLQPMLVMAEAADGAAFKLLLLQRNIHDENLLMYIVSRGTLQQFLLVFKLVIDNGLLNRLLSQYDMQGENFVIKAIRVSRWPRIVEEIFDALTTIPSEAAEVLETASDSQALAVAEQNSALMRPPLDLFEQILTRPDQHQRTPLMTAIECADNSIIDLIIAKLQERNLLAQALLVHDYCGCNPLMFALRSRKHTELVKFIIQSAKELNVLDKVLLQTDQQQRNTLLFALERSNDLVRIKYIIGIDEAGILTQLLQGHDASGNNVLMAIFSRGRADLDVFKLIIDKTRKAGMLDQLLTETDHDGNNVLMLALRYLRVQKTAALILAIIDSFEGNPAALEAVLDHENNEHQTCRGMIERLNHPGKIPDFMKIMKLEAEAYKQITSAINSICQPVQAEATNGIKP